MKTPATSILALACATAFAFSALADTWADPKTKITWTYTVNGGKAIVDYTSPVSGAIAIPSMMGGCPVVSIGSGAFWDCSALTSVTIPPSVTSIGSYAFYDCSGLTSVTIPSSVATIEEGAFLECNALTSVTIPACVTKLSSTFPDSYSRITKVVICDGVTSIGDYAFYGCSALTSVTIPPSVTSIGDYALYSCSKLTRVIIPPSVTSIGESAFDGCSGLTNVTIFEGVTSIGDSAFYGCSALTSMTIPSSVKSIGSSAFSACSALTSVTIPSSVTNISDSAFSDCSKLGSVTIPSSVTSIGWGAFSGCSALTSVTIPSSVKSVGWGAFYGCDSLTTVYVDAGDKTRVKNLTTSSLTFIETYRVTYEPGSDGIGAGQTVRKTDGVAMVLSDAIFMRDGYTQTGWKTKRDLYWELGANYTHDFEITLYPVWTQGVYPDGSYISTVNGIAWKFTVSGGKAMLGTGKPSGRTIATDTSGTATIPSVLGGCPVVSIGNFAFYGCSALTSVTIPSSVTNIGNEAFYDCKRLTSVTIPSSVANIGTSVFSGCSWLTTIIVDTANTCYASDDGVLYNKTFTKLLACPSRKTSVTIPSSVTSIGDSAFSDCSGLTSVTIPSSVISIGAEAFSGCSALTSVTIPSSVTSIAYQTFYECGWLTSVTIPSSVTSIEEEAFEGCNALATVYVGEGDTSRVRTLLTNSGFSPSSLTFIEFSYRVTYEPGSNGEGTKQTETKTYGVALTLKGAIFTRTGYTQTGWATSDGGSFAYALGGTYTANAAIVLYPYWTANTYTVTYNPGSYGSGSQQTATKTQGVALTLKGEIFTRSGYTQTGWATTEGGAKAYALGGSYTANAAITLYPYWTANTYTVTYNPGSYGSGSQQTATKTQGVALTLKGEIFTRSGYAQTGWATTDGGAKAYALGGSYTANAAITLYPVWTANTYAVTYRPGANGTGSLVTATKTHDVALTLKGAIFTRTGYTQTGWATTDGGTLAYKPGASYTANAVITLYPVWTVDAYPDGSYTNTVNGIAWTFTVSDGKTIIGTGSWNGTAIPTSTKGAITIPSSLGGYPVTSIGSYAFRDCSALTSVTIPSSVTSIGSYAFYFCSGLTSMTIPSNVTNIGDFAFSCCSGLKSVLIPSSVTSIGRSAFTGCSGMNTFSVDVDNPSYKSMNGLLLTKDGQTLIAGVNGDVTIPSGVMSIGDGAFCGCSGLTRVMIPSSVTNVGIYAFQACSGLNEFSVDIDNPSYKSMNGLLLTKDGQTLVAGVNGNVTIPSSVTNIVHAAFMDCSGLTSVTIPSSVTSIDWGAFYDCNSLATVYVDAGDAMRVQTLLSNSGFSTSGLTFVETNLTFYQVKYDPGSVGCGSQQTATKAHGVTVTLKGAIFTRTGYTQTGWATSDGGTQAYALGGTYTADTAITLYPVWTPLLTKVSDPVITAASGTTFETETCSISITCTTPGASIYYRTDGGTPRPTSKYLYTGAFTISETSEIVALAVKDGLEDSEYVSLTVTKVIREPLTLEKALEIPLMTVTTGGDADWQAVD